MLIFGGTGSLGYEWNKNYKENNTLYNFSRDENKHWEMRLHFNNHPNIRFIIGNVADQQAVEQAIQRVNPHIIIIASAMKHIDQCEINTGDSLKTNLLGTKHILDTVEKFKTVLNRLETVVFVSSDKACNPINHYGLCKAMAETLVVEKAFYIPEIKFVNVRYGNVLNSRGSIIPLLHKIGQDPQKPHFTLTCKEMTRFVMTLEQSVQLIEYAILQGETGDTIIPHLVSLHVLDLLEIFSKKYGKPISTVGTRSGEKCVEALINETQSGRIAVEGNYTHIKSVLKYPNRFCDYKEVKEYNSLLNPLSQEKLQEYLENLNLLSLSM